jgi:HAD superfamily hydrolase (TIGR01509 family)
MKALGFDFGHTLAELDYAFLATRLAERGVEFDRVAAEAVRERAWHVYGELKQAGHAAAWSAMMQMQLEGGGLTEPHALELARWLWSEQPRVNLWRKPLPGMIELVRELKQRGVPIAVISNSEGRLAELCDELGWTDAFDVVVDSGRVGIDKPDPRIFEHACRELGVAASELLHVGDSWEADVLGALGASASAVWFDERHRQRALPERVFGAASAPELREVLARLSLVG